MTSEPLCCPYCNAYVTPPSNGIQPGQRLSCSRCGETFEFRGSLREGFDPSPSRFTMPSAPTAAPSMPRPGKPWSNRRIALVVLAGMATMACIGLVLALATQTVRRSHDAGLPKDRRLPLYLTVFVGIWVIGLAFVAVRELQIRHQRSSGTQRLPLGYILATITFLALGGLAVTMLAVQISAQRASRPALETETPIVQAVPPAALSSLGYVPPDSDFVAGIHVAETLADPLAKEFVARFTFGPGLNLSAIEKWTGLTLQDMDHVVLAVRIEGMLTPRIMIAIRTARLYDAQAIRSKLNVSHNPISGKGQVYRLTVENSLLTPHLWFVNDQTLIVGGSAKDLEAVPGTPHSGSDQLRPEIARLLRERMGQGTPLWMAGAPHAWDQTLLWGLLLGRQSKEEREVLSKITAFGLWFQFGNSLTLQAAIQASDAKAAKSLQAYFTGHDLGEQKPFHMDAPRPELAPIYRELGQSLKSEVDNAWLLLQARAGTETVQKALHP